MASVYEQVRERILSSLASGTVPWRQTWQGMTPCNVLTGRPYRGINRILLAGSPWWGTYNQVRQMGGYVRRGERAAGMVVFWSMEECRREVNDQGDEVLVRGLRDRPLVRCYKVFHIGQCEGVTVPEGREVRPIVSCEGILGQNEPRVLPGEPAYAPGRDVITMPPAGRFISAEAYYATLFHELTHWTGAAHRLNREGITEAVRFGSERYSREELTAEMGAAFLCAMCGVDTPPLQENTAAYIAGWLRHIREGSAADVVRAATDAQRAADFLTGGFVPASSSSTLALCSP
jgi:antirestriction protein ArdC